MEYRNLDMWHQLYLAYNLKILDTYKEGKKKRQ